MFLFLDTYWKLGNRESEELANLLSSLSLLPDGVSADPALMDDWKKCVSDMITFEEKSGDKPWELRLQK